MQRNIVSQWHHVPCINQITPDNLIYMSYLKFDKTLLTNLEQSLDIEYLRTNKSGAYSSTSVTGCNTRKYHGLLVIPIPELDDDNHVLLSSLDETVIQHGAEFNLVDTSTSVSLIVKPSPPTPIVWEV